MGIGLSSSKKGLAWIVPVGNELLIGRIIDTNSAWIARRLTFLGYKVIRVVKVPDDLNEISEEIKRGLERCEVVITTGGLGPTYDDKTLEAVALATNRKLVLNEEALKMVEEFYRRKSLPLTKERTKMAMLPEGSKALRNPVGAAPGVYLEMEDSVIVSLPGVPAEMKSIFEDSVEPLLKLRAPPRRVWECYVEIRGVPESTLAPFLEEIARKNPSSYIKSHPKGHEIKEPILDLRVLTSGDNLEDVKKMAQEIAEKIALEAVKLGGKIASKGCKAPD